MPKAMIKANVIPVLPPRIPPIAINIRVKVTMRSVVLIPFISFLLLFPNKKDLYRDNIIITVKALLDIFDKYFTS